MPHRLNVLLIASGGGWADAELPCSTIDHHDRPGYGRGADSRDERLGLRRADPYGLELVTIALVANVDVVVPVDQGHPSLVADADVLRPEALLEGLGPEGGVVVSSLVVL